MGLVGVVATFAIWGTRAFESGSDAILAERWSAFVQRATVWITGASVAAAMTSLPAPLLAAPLLPLLVATAIYPARRRVLEETRSFGAYIAFQIRLLVAMGGMVLVIGLLPELVHRAPLPAHVAAPILLALAIALMWAIGKYYPQLLGAQPLARGAVFEALQPILEHARCKRPEIYVVDPRGGRFANALALPSIKQPRVLLGATLIENLSIQEVAAIFAHELAHLEHHDAKYLRRIGIVVTALMFAAAALVPALEPIAPAAVPVVNVVWAFTALIGWLAWLGSRQAHEGDCDVRSVELIGDAEAMITALTKLHALGRIPRRAHLDAEASASHPTLQRRIERLRRVQGSKAPPPIPFETLIAQDVRVAGTFLVLSDTHVRLLQGVPAGVARDEASLMRAAANVQAFMLADVASMALGVRGGGSELVATDKQRRKLRLSVGPNDVAPIQAALDALDARGVMTQVPASGQPDRTWAALLAGVALLAIDSVLDAPGAFTVLALCLTFASGQRAVLHAALATCAVYTAMSASWLGLVHPAPPEEGPVWPWIAALGVFCALASLRARRRGQSPPASLVLVGTLALFGVPSAIALVFLASSSFDLHVAQLRNPNLALFCAALAAALATGIARRRFAGYALFALVAWATLASTPWFRAVVVRDPILVAARPLRWQKLSAKPKRTIEIDRRLHVEALSPSLRWALVRPLRDDDYYVEEGPRAALELFDLEAEPQDAQRSLGLAPRDEAAFNDDASLSVLAANAQEELELAIVGIADLKETSRVALGHAAVLTRSPLSIDRAARRYAIHARSRDGGGQVRLLGAIGAAPDERRLLGQAFPISEGVPDTHDLAYRVRPGASLSWSRRFAPIGWAMGLPPQLGQGLADVVEVTAAGPRALFSTQMGALRCVVVHRRSPVQACLVMGMQGAYAIEIDAQRTRVASLHEYPEPVFDLVARGALFGARSTDNLYLNDLRRESAHVLPLPEEGGAADCFSQPRLMDDVIALVRSCRDRTSIELIDLP